ncbi:DUF6003 family protein [Streptomyces erythrochromogenes]|uniref:DUF6003 family protein n=1 Tax=Streptomyces erythrochromogenes TaxID=285574 RepID=UPI003330029F
MNDAEKDAAERDLKTFRQAMDERDSLVRQAVKAGISKHRIHQLSGIARTTIDRILANTKETRP